MSVLVDSSVWVGRVKRRNDHLVALFEDGAVVCHPCVVAEVACGTPSSRKAIIGMLTSLDRARVATQEELLAMLDARQFFGRVLGLLMSVCWLAHCSASGH